MGLSDGSMLKNLPTMQETQKLQVGSLGWEDPLRRKWQPTQYSCLENPMDRGASQATVHRFAKS